MGKGKKPQPEQSKGAARREAKRKQSGSLSTLRWVGMAFVPVPIAGAVWMLLRHMLYGDCPGGERLGPGGWCLGSRYRGQLPPEQCNIARRPLSDLLDESTKVPLDEPIIFTNATAAWPALERWARDELLQDPRRGQLVMKYGLPTQLIQDQFGEASASQKSDVSVADFIRKIRQSPDHYIFHRLPNKGEVNHSLGQAFREDINVPKTLSGKLWKKMTLALGGSGSGMLFHGHDVAWCALLFGRKRWFMLDQQDQSGALVLSPDTTNHEFMVTKYAQDKRFRKYWRHSGWECVQEAGELMYIPAWVTHAVLNIGETIGIVSEKCDMQKFAYHPDCQWKPIDVGKRQPRQKLQM